MPIPHTGVPAGKARREWLMLRSYLRRAREKEAARRKENDLPSFITNAMHDGEDKTQLRAIEVEVQMEQFHNPTPTDTDL